MENQLPKHLGRVEEVRGGHGSWRGDGSVTVRLGLGGRVLWSFVLLFIFRVFSFNLFFCFLKVSMGAVW